MDISIESIYSNANPLVRIKLKTVPARAKIMDQRTAKSTPFKLPYLNRFTM